MLTILRCEKKKRTSTRNNRDHCMNILLLPSYQCLDINNSKVMVLNLKFSHNVPFALFKSRMQNQREKRGSIPWKNVRGHARFFHITNSHYFIQLHHIQRYISEKGV